MNHFCEAHRSWDVGDEYRYTTYEVHAWMGRMHDNRDADPEFYVECYADGQAEFFGASKTLLTKSQITQWIPERYEAAANDALDEVIGLMAEQILYEDDRKDDT